MREVFEVAGDKLQQADRLLKEDDLVSRQSIAIRSPAVLDMKGDKTFIIINGSEEAIKHAEKLLKGIAEKSKHQKEVLEKFDELEDKASEAFGAILGG